MAKILHTFADRITAYKAGVCVAINVPAKTDNDWGDPRRTIDLPLMDRETFHDFVESMNQIERDIFGDD